VTKEKNDKNEREVVDIPYDMITSVRLDKGMLSSNVIFRAPGLRNSGSRLRMLEKLTGNEYDASGDSDDTVITAIPKDVLLLLMLFVNYFYICSIRKYQCLLYNRSQIGL
jgi:hypothetical protein